MVDDKHKDVVRACIMSEKIKNKIEDMHKTGCTAAYYGGLNQAVYTEKC